MTTAWPDCKNILCIRADNMGDLLMSSPAIRAFKETFQCRITVMTSSMATCIAKFLDGIDEVITYDLPWVKKQGEAEAGAVLQLVEQLKSRHFDAAVIFTVYSQNPLPAAMLTYLAGISRRLAYCRENPYELLTDWIPDKEPYSLIRHQVRRDLELAASVGAHTKNDKLYLRLPDESWSQVQSRLVQKGVDVKKPWLIVHAGVSEKKREYPFHSWAEAGKKIIQELRYQIILTGASSEKELAESLQQEIGECSFALAGEFSLEEFMCLVMHSPLLISVNSGPIHIAAAVGTPVVLLYALTNPQHLPWKVRGKALVYDVPEHLRSKNEVIKFVHDHAFYQNNPKIYPEDILNAAKQILCGKAEIFPEMIPLRDFTKK